MQCGSRHTSQQCHLLPTFSDSSWCTLSGWVSWQLEPNLCFHHPSIHHRETRVIIHFKSVWNCIWCLIKLHLTLKIQRSFVSSWHRGGQSQSIYWLIALGECQASCKNDLLRRVPKRVRLSPKPPPFSHQKHFKIRENPKFHLKAVEESCFPSGPQGSDNVHLLPDLLLAQPHAGFSPLLAS